MVVVYGCFVTIMLAALVVCILAVGIYITSLV